MSRRLRDLEAMRFVERIKDPATGSVDYLRTEAAVALEPALDALARWAQCHIEATSAICTTTVSNLMWNMRKLFDPQELPRRRLVMQFRFADQGLDFNTYWALIQSGAEVEICTSIPGFDIDLYVETNRLSMTAILLRRARISGEMDSGALFLSGDPVLIRNIDRWLKPGEYTHYDDIALLSEVGRAPNRVVALV